MANCEEPPLVGGEHDLLHVRLGVGGEDGPVGEVPDIDLVSLGQDQRLPIKTQSCRRYLEIIKFYDELLYQLQDKVASINTM